MNFPEEKEPTSLSPSIILCIVAGTFALICVFVVLDRYKAHDKEQAYLDELGKEPIVAYHSEIRVQPDRNITVTELIKVNAQGEKIKRGIRRALKNSPGDEATGLPPSTVTLNYAGLDGETLKPPAPKRMGNREIYSLVSPKGNLQPGEHDCQLQYTTTNKVAGYPDRDELIWNVTDAWPALIKGAAATVVLPRFVDGQTVNYQGGVFFKGGSKPLQDSEVFSPSTEEEKNPVVKVADLMSKVEVIVEEGSTEQLATVKFWTKEPIMPGQQMIIKVSWPAGYMRPIS